MVQLIGQMPAVWNLQERAAAAEWKTQIVPTVPLEIRLWQLLVMLFRRQQELLLARVRNMDLIMIADRPQGTFTGSDSILIAERQVLPINLEVKQGVEATLPVLTLDEPTWNQVFQRVLAVIVELSYTQAGRNILQRVGIEPSEFTKRNPAFRAYVNDKVIKFSGFVNGETNARLNAIIKPILLQGGPAEQVRVRIQEAIQTVFASSTRGTAPRARMIARTEIAGAHNAGSLDAMRVSGVVAYKTWRTSKDVKVRLSHKITDGQTVPIDSLFRIINPDSGNVSYLDAPGDAEHGAGPEETINCRCVVLPSRRPRS